MSVVFQSGFTIDSDTVQMTLSAPAASVNVGGKTLDRSSGACYAVADGTVARVVNGFGFDSNGALVVTDASAGLPSPRYYRNGMPFDANGALCVDLENDYDRTQNGIPFTTIGAVAIGGISFASYYLQEGGSFNYLTEDGTGYYELES